jgi:putative pyruvate formate lyase activating enzyme
MSVAYPELHDCHICPQDCGANRYTATGFCGAGHQLRINLAHLHHGEEPVLSGSRGSGTIFLSHCNLRCVYCQNHEISHLGWGTSCSELECAGMMLRLQEAGAHNINLVSPTHFSLQLAESIRLAKADGLHIPVVWNSNGYEKVDTLKRLAGLVDIYLPDFKYAHAAYSLKYSRAKDYPAVALDALKEMHRQAGDLVIAPDGMACRGLLVRHLVLPNRLSGTRDVLYLLHENFGENLALSLMAQYYPAARATEYPELARGLYQNEYQEALDLAEDLGFTRVFAQELESSPDWTPSFQPEGTPIAPERMHFRGKENHDKV